MPQTQGVPGERNLHTVESQTRPDTNWRDMEETEIYTVYNRERFSVGVPLRVGGVDYRHQDVESVVGPSPDAVSTPEGRALMDDYNQRLWYAHTDNAVDSLRFDFRDTETQDRRLNEIFGFAVKMGVQRERLQQLSDENGLEIDLDAIYEAQNQSGETNEVGFFDRLKQGVKEYISRWSGQGDQAPENESPEQRNSILGRRVLIALGLTAFAVAAGIIYFNREKIVGSVRSAAIDLAKKFDNIRNRMPSN